VRFSRLIAPATDPSNHQPPTTISSFNRQRLLSLVSVSTSPAILVLARSLYSCYSHFHFHCIIASSHSTGTLLPYTRPALSTSLFSNRQHLRLSNSGLLISATTCVSGLLFRVNYLLATSSIIESPTDIPSPPHPPELENTQHLYTPDALSIRSLAIVHHQKWLERKTLLYG
jgi:hypothetical protein